MRAVKAAGAVNTAGVNRSANPNSSPAMAVRSSASGKGRVRVESEVQVRPLRLWILTRALPLPDSVGRKRLTAHVLGDGERVCGARTKGVGSIAGCRERSSFASTVACSPRGFALKSGGRGIELGLMSGLMCERRDTAIDQGIRGARMLLQGFSLSTSIARVTTCCSSQWMRLNDTATRPSASRM